MEISKLSEAQAMDMGITEAAVRQAERAAEAREIRNDEEWRQDRQIVRWDLMGRTADADHAEALELNAQVVYVEGHGTRAYILTDVVRYDNGDFLYSVRPLSSGMEWTYDRRRFGTVPFEI